MPEYDTNCDDWPAVSNVVIVGFNFVNGPDGDVLTDTLLLSRPAKVSPIYAVTWMSWLAATATRNWPSSIPADTRKPLKIFTKVSPR